MKTSNSWVTDCVCVFFLMQAPVGKWLCSHWLQWTVQASSSLAALCCSWTVNFSCLARRAGLSARVQQECSAFGLKMARSSSEPSPSPMIPSTSLHCAVRPFAASTRTTGFRRVTLIHGGRTPNNEISSSLYLLTMDSRGSNRKLTVCCKEKDLVGEVPGGRYGHSLSMVQSRGKTACVLFGGRSYIPAGERTTESWNSVVDCPPQVFLFDLEFGCSSAHTFPELSEGLSFHVALAREDCVYFIGGHSFASDSRPPRLFRLHVELLQGSPLVTCETLDTGISISSAIITRTGPTHTYIISGGYKADSQKRTECTTVSLDERGIHFEALESPTWTPDIVHSRTWFGGSAGDGNILLAVPTEGRAAQTDMHYFYLASFQTEGGGKGEAGTQGCSQESTDYEDSTPLEDSEELYFGREPHELEDSSGEEDTYNEEDEEDESQAGYWIKCCLGCQVDANTWDAVLLHRAPPASHDLLLQRGGGTLGPRSVHGADWDPAGHSLSGLQEVFLPGPRRPAPPGDDPNSTSHAPEAHPHES